MTEISGIVQSARKLGTIESVNLEIFQDEPVLMINDAEGQQVALPIAKYTKKWTRIMLDIVLGELDLKPDSMKFTEGHELALALYYLAKAYKKQNLD